MFALISPDPSLRALAIDAHLVTLAIAGLGVALGDWALFGGSQIERRRLQRAGLVVTIGLAGLWLSGLWIVALDTGLQWQQIAARPKLLAKLGVVLALTLNGLALHAWGFPRLFDPVKPPRVVLPILLGSLSMCGWMYATFLGLAGRLTPGWSYANYLLGFVLLLAMGTVLGLGPLRAWLTARLSRSEALLRPLPVGRVRLDGRVQARSSP